MAGKSIINDLNIHQSILYSYIFKTLTVTVTFVSVLLNVFHTKMYILTIHQKMFCNFKLFNVENYIPFDRRIDRSTNASLKATDILVLFLNLQKGFCGG